MEEYHLIPVLVLFFLFLLYVLRLLLAEVTAAAIASCRYIPKALTVVFVNDDEEEETNIGSLLFRLPLLVLVVSKAAAILLRVLPFLGAIMILIILLTVFVMLNRTVPQTPLSFVLGSDCLGFVRSSTILLRHEYSLAS